MFNDIRKDENGIGIMTALMVSFVVFSLGAIWYSLAGHELDQVVFDRNRTQSVNVAESGAREAMAWLARDVNSFRTDAMALGVVTSGMSLGAPNVCTIQQLTTVVDGAPRIQGEYWVRVTHLGDLDFHIESWGWAPNRAARQSVAKKVELDIELIQLDGFRSALFAAGGGFVGGNRKIVYGDVYSGSDVSITNQTTILANDPGWLGDGTFNVYGNLAVNGLLQVAGDVNVQGWVNDSTAGTEYFSSVLIRNDAVNVPGGDTPNYMQSPEISNELKMVGTLDPASSVTTGTGLWIENATDLIDDPVLEINLPFFDWDPATDPGRYPGLIVHPTVGDFQAWLSANSANVEGVHYISSAAGEDIRWRTLTFTNHTLVVVNGSVTLRDAPAGGSTPSGVPATLAIVQKDPTGDLLLGRNFKSLNNELHHLLYSAGGVGSVTNSLVYGVVYGFEDVSTNLLEIHFRPPADEVVGEFEFDLKIRDTLIPEPRLWRDLPPTVPFPIETYCTP